MDAVPAEAGVIRKLPNGHSNRGAVGRCLCLDEVPALLFKEVAEEVAAAIADGYLPSYCRSAVACEVVSVRPYHPLFPTVQRLSLLLGAKFRCLDVHRLDRNGLY